MEVQGACYDPFFMCWTSSFLVGLVSAVIAWARAETREEFGTEFASSFWIVTALLFFLWITVMAVKVYK